MAKQKFVPEFSLYGKKDYFEDLNLLNNDKNKEKLIKNIEAIIRTSQEYRNYIRYLKNDAELTYCSLMNILPEDIAKHIKIEMHHFPYTLYDLVDIVLTKALSLGTDYTRLSIANEVMELHFSNQIGLVPLTVTAHQMMHNNHYFLHKEEVFGNYETFFERYKPYLQEEHHDKIIRLRATNKDIAAKRKLEVLTVKPELYIEYDPETMDLIELPAPIDEVEEPMDENPLVTASKKGKSDKVSSNTEEITEEDDNDLDLDELAEDDSEELPEPPKKKESKKTQTKIPSMSNRSKLSDHFEDDE